MDTADAHPPYTPRPAPHTLSPGMAPLPPLRLAVLGCALGRARYGAALTATPAILPALLCDADETLARLWAREIGYRTPVETSPDALLERADAYDALLIAAPLPARTDYVTRALQRSIPTLCEIPPALRLPAADAVLRAAADASSPLLPALPRRFDPHFHALTRAIASGELGAIRQIRCDWSLPMNSMEDADEGLQGDWNALLQAVLCQTADLCHLWLGEAESVSADIEVASLRGVDTPEGRRVKEGALANVIVGHDRGQSTHHISRTRTLYAEEKYVVRGTLQTLELLVSTGGGAQAGPFPRLRAQKPGQRPTLVTLADAPGAGYRDGGGTGAESGNESTTEAAEPRTGNGLTRGVRASSLSAAHRRVQNLLRHFADVVQLGAIPQVTMADGRAALEIVHAAYLSAFENSKVLLPLLRPPDIEALLYPQKRLV